MENSKKMIEAIKGATDILTLDGLLDDFLAERGTGKYDNNTVSAFYEQVDLVVIPKINNLTDFAAMGKLIYHTWQVIEVELSLFCIARSLFEKGEELISNTDDPVVITAIKNEFYAKKSFMSFLDEEEYPIGIPFATKFLPNKLMEMIKTFDSDFLRKTIFKELVFGNRNEEVIKAYREKVIIDPKIPETPFKSKSCSEWWFSCPNCYCDVKRNQGNCSRCQQIFDWSEIDEILKTEKEKG
jgi:hypothetical protein